MSHLRHRYRCRHLPLPPHSSKCRRHRLLPQHSSKCLCLPSPHSSKCLCLPSPHSSKCRRPQSSLSLAKPPKPIMAILVESSKGVWTVRSGGLPHEDWTGLIAPSWVVSPLQLRPAFIGDAQKAYKYRITGLKDKFEENGDITYFADEFERHLRTTGMDTIASPTSRIPKRRRWCLSSPSTPGSPSLQSHLAL